MSTKDNNRTKTYPQPDADHEELSALPEDFAQIDGDESEAEMENIDLTQFAARQISTKHSPVLAMIRHSLTTLLPEIQKLRGADRNHTKPIEGALYMLETVEADLDELAIDLTSSDELYQAAREMAGKR